MSGEHFFFEIAGSIGVDDQQFAVAGDFRASPASAIRGQIPLQKEGPPFLLRFAPPRFQNRWQPATSAALSVRLVHHRRPEHKVDVIP